MEYDADFYAILIDAIGGAELTEKEVRCIKWLAGWDKYTIENIAAIIRKARRAEREQGRPE